MVSRKKTYGAPTLMEWQANINCGGATVGIHFSGGSQTAYGINPAKYTTEDPAIQAIIENSGYYKEGRIVLLSDVEGSGAYSIPDPARESEAEEAAPKEEGIPSGEVGDEAEEAAPKEEGIPSGDVGDEAESPSSALRTVEVTCLDDAKQYLMDHFGLAARNLRSKKAIEDAARQYGIVFSGI